MLLFTLAFSIAFLRVRLRVARAVDLTDYCEQVVSIEAFLLFWLYDLTQHYLLTYGAHRQPPANASDVDRI